MCEPAAIVLQNRSLVAFIFNYQCGVYADVRTYFQLFRKDVQFQWTCGRCNGVYFVSDQILSTEELGLNDFNKRDERFPLHFAIYQGNLHATKRILACRSDLAYAEAIETAFLCGHVAIAKYLLNQRVIYPQLSHRLYSINTRSQSQRIGIHLPLFTIARDNVDELTLLRTYSQEGWTVAVLKAAIRQRCINAAEFVYINIPETRFTGALDMAAEFGHTNLVQIMTENNEPATTRAMDKAASGGHLSIVKYLHEHRNEGCTTDAIDNAAAAGYFDIVKYLTTHRTEGCTTSAIAQATTQKHWAIVEFLQNSDVLVTPSADPVDDIKVPDLGHVFNVASALSTAIDAAITPIHAGIRAIKYRLFRA